MIESAIEARSSTRIARRHANASRISREAQRLAEARGIDGFTMDELAEAAGVSRRTLFNYFPSKDDAILGPMPQLDPDLLAAFRTGGPHGHLIDDLAALVDNMLQREDLSRDDIALAHRCLERNPRLAPVAHQRFHHVVEQLIKVVQEREGPTFGRTKAKVAIAVLAALFVVSLEAYVSDNQERTVADLYGEALSTARELLT